jgi:hypothetical protein
LEACKYVAFFAGDVRARTREVAESGQRRMNRSDRLLAGMLTARAVDARPVSDTLLDMMMRCNEARSESIALMHLGRANVVPDVKATRGENVAALSAMREVVKALSHGRPSSAAEEAAIASSVGAGHCGEFASVATATAAGALKPGEKLVRVRSKRIDHGFMLLSGNGYLVKFDGWGEGSAIDSVDGTYSRRRKDYEKRMVLKASEVPDFFTKFEKGLERAAFLKPRFDALMPAKRRERLDPQTLYSSSTPIVNEAFAKRVRDLIDRVPPPPEPKGSAAVGKTYSVIKHRCLSTVGLSKQVRARSTDKLRHHVPPQLLTQQQVRDMAIQSAQRMGFCEEEAMRNATRVIDVARNLRRPVPRTLRAPPPAPTDDLSIYAPGGRSNRNGRPEQR